LNIGIVGLGLMGQRMLDRIEAHPRLRTAWVWDADHGAQQRTLVARPTLRAAGQAAQLEQWVAMIEGRAHGLPGYAEALAVQQTIEALLAGR
jgi:predicted dehydrogenase